MNILVSNGRESANFCRHTICWLIHMSQCQSRCWWSVGVASAKYWSRCKLSVNQDANKMSTTTTIMTTAIIWQLPHHGFKDALYCCWRPEIYNLIWWRSVHRLHCTDLFHHWTSGISNEQYTGKERTIFSNRSHWSPTCFPSSLSDSLEQAKATGNRKQKRCSPFVTAPHRW